MAGYVSKKYKDLKKGMQREIAETITGLVEMVMRPMLLSYIEGTYQLKDGTTVSGQSAFDRLVREDKDIVALIERYRPSYLRYLDKARGVKEYINWSNDRFADNLTWFLQEHGIRVTEEGYRYLWRTCDRFRRRIYA